MDNQLHSHFYTLSEKGLRLEPLQLAGRYNFHAYVWTYTLAYDLMLWPGAAWTKHYSDQPIRTVSI